MKRTNLASAEAAAAAIHRAKQQLADARRRLARITRPDAPYVIVDPKMKWAADLVAQRGARLTQYPGVLGYTVGNVIEGGLPTGELCMTVFVRRKIDPAELRARNVKPLPKSIRAGKRRLRVDVVPLGKIRMLARAGSSLGPDSGFEEGTIGVFATDTDNGRRVAVTAMHVSGLDEFPNGGPAPRFESPSRLSGAPVPLGELVFGTRTGIDAAKIELFSSASGENTISGIGAIAGWRPLTVPGDQNLPVRLRGAVSTAVQRGVVVFPDVPLPQFGLQSAILADIPTNDGDSGAPLVDSNNHLIGFLVGAVESGDFVNLKLFTPAGLVFRILRCDLP